MAGQALEAAVSRRIGPAPVTSERRCMACETPNPSGNRYCGECGHSLTEHLENPSLAMISIRRAARCERKQATVLFTDVSGFTAMSERLDGEDMFRIMEQALSVIMEHVHRAGGTINQFLGDGAMALFGESNGQNHAERAIHAALAILSDLEPLRAEVRQAHGVEFRMRITINSGAVTLGTIGDSLRSDYAAAGETANAAAQLLQVARPGQILITEETRRLAGGGFLTEDLGKVGRVGVSTQTRAFAVQGWRPTSLLALLCA